MTISAPPSSSDSVIAIRAPLRPVVLIGEPGQTVEDDNVVDWLKVKTIERSAGARRVDAIALQVDFSQRVQRLQDTITPLGVNRQVEVQQRDDGGNVVRVLGWGLLSKQPFAIDDDSEGIDLVARLEPWLFGDPITQLPVWEIRDPAGVKWLDREMVFNPEIDEKICGNCAGIAIDETRNNMVLFADPESFRTRVAQSFQEDSAGLWAIWEAAHTLCWIANPDELWIRNPEFNELREALKDVDVNAIKNRRIKLGSYLPEALDQLLAPYGCSWCIDLVREKNTTVRRLRCFKEGKGLKVSLLLQRPPARVDWQQSNVAGFEGEYSIADLANRVVGVTGRIEREVTVELYKGWGPTLDNLDFFALESDQQKQKDYLHVGRKWVLNEGGDYTGLRPEITGPYDLRNELDFTSIVCRRRFKRCISQNAAGESYGYYVEWLNAEGNWEKVKWSFSVSEKECAIHFEGNKPPDELWAAMQGNPDKCRVRITAVIVGDEKTTKTAERQDTSPNPNDVTLWLDLKDKFHDRQVGPSSIFKGKGTADEHNDAADLQDYVDHVRSIEDFAAVECVATLEGLDHPDVKLGAVVEKIKGRDLPLNAETAKGGQKRLLQVVGLRMNFQGDNPDTELMLEALDEERDK